MEKRMKLFGHALLLQMLLYLTASLICPILPLDIVKSAWFSVILRLAVFLPPILFYIKASEYRLLDIEKVKKQKNTVWALSYVFALSLTVTLMNIVGTLTRLALGGEGASGFSSVADAVSTLITSVILAAILEEILFRGAFFHASDGQNRVVQMLLSGIFFALMHYSLAQFFYALSAGLVIAYFYSKNRSIIFSVLLHLGANLMTWIFGILRMNRAENIVLAEVITAGLFALISIAGCIIWVLKHEKITEAQCEERFIYVDFEHVTYIAGAVLLAVLL